MKMLALIVAVVCFLLAILYWVGVKLIPALGMDGQQHLKHGILFFILGALALVWMRFASNTGATRGV
ncbi:MAG: hypothetical protein GIW98_05130 [Candidatus Eremiobacteraeota bacterium]|nr:hypothetical protein [Candidatus Eremiobacteraeota bacterium]